MSCTRVLTLLFLILAICSCGESDPLDRNFHTETFTHIQLPKLMEHPDLSDIDKSDLFYVIRTHDDLGLDSLEGKSYRWILEQARNIRASGWPISVSRSESLELDDRLSINIETTGVGLQRVGDTKRLRKSTLAQMRIKNLSEKALTIKAIYADLHGPMGDWITTVAYELNCYVEADGQLVADVMLDGVNIDKQLKQGSRYGHLYAAMDTVLSNLTWNPQFIEVLDKTNHFSPCRPGAERRVPVAQVLVTDEKWRNYARLEKTPEGKPIILLESAILDFDRAEILQYR